MTVHIEHIAEGVASELGVRKRKRVLVCAGSYLPGSKDGGPIRSIANMVNQLSPLYDFYVVTRDRETADTRSFPGVVSNNWHRVGVACVLYCSSITVATLRRALQDVRPDIVSLNSFQDKFTRTVLLLRLLGALADTPVVLAIRGELSPGAMEIKRTKKTLYRHSMRLLGLYENLLWQVSTSREKLDLLRAAPARGLDPEKIYVAYNISDAVTSMMPHLEKEPGRVKLAFIARMSEMKNLHFLLEVLKGIRGLVHLNLYGPVAEKDEAYWAQCTALLAQLPQNIKVEYRGSLDHAHVSQVLCDHHFFVLPTRGENFCHAAVESFVNGTPVILSDATPWINLESFRAGFDISLKDRAGWTATLERCIDMDHSTYATFLEGARQYGRQFSVEAAINQHVVMFEAALAQSLKGGQLLNAS